MGVRSNHTSAFCSFLIEISSFFSPFHQTSLLFTPFLWLQRQNPVTETDLGKPQEFWHKGGEKVKINSSVRNCSQALFIFGADPQLLFCIQVR